MKLKQSAFQIRGRFATKSRVNIPNSDQVRRRVNTRSGRIISGLLLGHLLFGLGATWLATLGAWPVVYGIAFGGLIGGQLLLIGIWAGMANQGLDVKFAGMICGSAYLSGAIAIGMGLPHRTEEFAILYGLIVVTGLVICASFMAMRRYRGIAVRRSSDWGSPSSTPLRYSAKHLLLGTTLIAILLGCGSIIRSLGGEALGVVVLLIAFVICGLSMAYLVLWAGLGRGRTSLRLPSVLALGFVLGLLPPYLLGGPWWRFLTWPGLTVSAGAVATLSLLVVRSCGYRLVRSDLEQSVSPRPAVLPDSHFWAG